VAAAETPWKEKMMESRNPRVLVADDERVIADSSPCIDWSPTLESIVRKLRVHTLKAQLALRLHVCAALAKEFEAGTLGCRFSDKAPKRQSGMDLRLLPNQTWRTLARGSSHLDRAGHAAPAGIMS
jgi:hypothetical protein